MTVYTYKTKIPATGVPDDVIQAMTVQWWKRKFDQLLCKAVTARGGDAVSDGAIYMMDSKSLCDAQKNGRVTYVNGRPHYNDIAVTVNDALDGVYLVEAPHEPDHSAQTIEIDGDMLTATLDIPDPEVKSLKVA